MSDDAAITKIFLHYVWFCITFFPVAIPENYQIDSEKFKII